jgi:hypothetical protein
MKALNVVRWLASQQLVLQNVVGAAAVFLRFAIGRYV